MPVTVCLAPRRRRSDGRGHRRLTAHEPRGRKGGEERDPADRLPPVAAALRAQFSLRLDPPDFEAGD